MAVALCTLDVLSSQKLESFLCLTGTSLGLYGMWQDRPSEYSVYGMRAGISALCDSIAVALPICAC